MPLLMVMFYRSQMQLEHKGWKATKSLKFVIRSIQIAHPFAKFESSNISSSCTIATIRKLIDTICNFGIVVTNEIILEISKYLEKLEICLAILAIGYHQNGTCQIWLMTLCRQPYLAIFGSRQNGKCGGWHQWFVFMFCTFHFGDTPIAKNGYWFHLLHFPFLDAFWAIFPKNWLTNIFGRQK